MAHHRQLEPQRHRGRGQSRHRARSSRAARRPPRRREVLLLARGAAEDGAAAWLRSHRADAPRRARVQREGHHAARSPARPAPARRWRRPADRRSSIELAAMEFGLLQLLVERRRTVTDAELAYVAWHEIADALSFRSVQADSENVRELVHRVRRKLASVAADDLIESKRGVGYRLAGEPALTDDATEQSWTGDSDGPSPPPGAVGDAAAPLRARVAERARVSPRRPPDRAVRRAVRGRPRGARSTGCAATRRRRRPGALPVAAPLLLVPPLMVASEVYDISPDVSAVALLSRRDGIDVWLVDFGAPEREEGGMEPHPRRSRARGVRGDRPRARGDRPATCTSPATRRAACSATRPRRSGAVARASRR